MHVNCLLAFLRKDDTLKNAFTPLPVTLEGQKSPNMEEVTFQQKHWQPVHGGKSTFQSKWVQSCTCRDPAEPWRAPRHSLCTNLYRRSPHSIQRGRLPSLELFTANLSTSHRAVTWMGPSLTAEFCALASARTEFSSSFRRQSSLFLFTHNNLQ